MAKALDGKTDLLRVVCGDGSVLGVLEVQPEGKKVMGVKAFANGLRGQTLRWTSPPVDPSPSVTAA
jgi:methionyl-tRNA formyltransferase